MNIRLTDRGPHIAVVTIDNPPKRNAMTRGMLGELARLWAELAAGPHRCIVLTGAGERAFTSGADLGGDLSVSPAMARQVNDALLKTRAYPKPIVAAVNGDCVAGGVELLLSTDIRIAAAHARFGLPEVKWGVYPFGGATVKLWSQIGYARAMDLLLTGRLIGADEAASLGLVNRVVPGEAVMAEALAVAEAIAANSPAAVQAVKRQVSGILAEAAAAREAMEQALGDGVRASPDFKEGVAAFLEKRAPRYA
ncbi:MAG: enoyl-CoA hydratase/isomerase family protein [Alphaproteobacteria bacterium]